MTGLDPRTPVSDQDRMAHELKLITDRLDALEAPTGTSLYQTVAKLQALVEDIQAQLDAWTSTRYTNAQIDSKVANPGAISPTSVSTSGGGSFGGNLSVGGVFYNPPAYGFDITYTRRAAWLGNDGRLGYASSSADKKVAITEADIDPAAVLKLAPREFYYREEIRRRTRLRINEGADYRPAREVGLLAHELDELGLGWLVYHDEQGNAEGIEYSMLAVALLAVVRDQDARISALEGGAA